MAPSKITLHGSEISGHTHRVELMLRMLDLQYRFVSCPPQTRQTAEFLSMNPLGQVPVLQDGDVTLADSNAILVFLAKRYGVGKGWLPEDAVSAALVQRWLSIAAGEIAAGPNLARLIRIRGMAADYARAVAIAERILRYMNQHLERRTYLAAAHPTIADLACYSYVAMAGEGDISLEAYPAVRAWLRRVETVPGFKAMPASPPFRG